VERAGQSAPMLWRAKTSSGLDVEVGAHQAGVKPGCSGVLNTCSDGAGDQLQR
jgi:hypothetical protein